MALDERFVQRMIIKAALEDTKFMASTSGVIDNVSYFSSAIAGQLYDRISSHFKKYEQLPTRHMLVNSFPEKEKADVEAYLDDVEKTDVSPVLQYEYVLDRTDEWLRYKAIQAAIMESADYVTHPNNFEYGYVKELVEKALTKTIRIDLGMDYFRDAPARLKNIFTKAEIRIPTYYPTFDEFLSDGFPPYTLSIMVGKIHKGKSNLMINFATRQVMHGHNVAIFSLEMSRDAVAQRIDAMLTNLDMNRIYNSQRTELMRGLMAIKNDGKHGTLYIKDFPPHSASVQDFKSYLYELSIRGFKPDILYCDYVNLMKPVTKGGKNANLYEDVKRISEELRAMSFEFEIPIVSVSQFNRAGMMVPLEDLDYAHVSESVSLAATADFMAFLGNSDDLQTYQNELHYKIIKNRLGPGLMKMSKFFMDDRSLRLYDELELDMWIADAAVSHGNRDIAEPRQTEETQTRRRRSNS